jgi:hypothetical protein
MDRKLTLELLRIAVAQKLQIGPGQTWKAAHWDRLEGYFEDAVQAQKAKWKGDFDGEGKQIAAPDIKTAKDFLHISQERILQIRNSGSDRVGIPAINTQDYLVRILGFSFDKLRDFEACVTVLDLHPDQVKAEHVNLLERIAAQLAASGNRPTDFPQANHVAESEQDAAMESDAVEGTRNPESGTTDPFDFEISGGLDDAAISDNAQADGQQFPPRISRPQKAIALVFSLLGIGILASWTWYHFLGNASLQSDPATGTNPLVHLSTTGDNSPIINADGDVHYWVGSLDQDTTDTSTLSK